LLVLLRQTLAGPLSILFIRVIGRLKQRAKSRELKAKRIDRHYRLLASGRSLKL